MEITNENHKTIFAANIGVNAYSPAHALDKALTSLDRVARNTGKVAAIETYRIEHTPDSHDYVVYFGE